MQKAANAPAAAPPVDQPEFTKLEMKVGVLTKTWHHPGQDSENVHFQPQMAGLSVAVVLLSV